MERGKLFLEDKPRLIYVFEGLIAFNNSPRSERLATRRRKYKLALSFWQVNVKVADQIWNYVNRLQQPIDVISWHPYGFEDDLRQWLDDHDVPASEVRTGTYAELSHRIATDPAVQCVFDPDPTHRFGYGFKGRGADA